MANGGKFWERLQGNIGVVEYVDDAGLLQTKVFKSVSALDWKARLALPGDLMGSWGHSEKLLLKFLESEKVDLSRVTRLYTEFSPCRKCSKLLNTIPDVPIYYSFKYGNAAARNLALRSLRNSLGLTGMGTLFKR